MNSTNPMLKSKAFDNGAVGAETMSVVGVANKSVALLALAAIGFGWTWNLFSAQGWPAVQPWLFGGLCGGLVFALIIAFAPTTAAFLSPVYAVLEGFVLGGISAVFELRYPGIAVSSILLTFGVFLSLLLLYRCRLIRVSETFKMVVASATGAVLLVYVVGFVGALFGWSIPLIHESGPVGILFSLVVVGIAAMNLVLDFDFIEAAVGRAPKHLEWYAAFGLLVTLVWLYLEVLRLLSKLRGR